MPPFFDRVHLHQAVSSQAVPILEAIAANDNLRSLRRFEQDDPPPYVSSTESEELDDADLLPPPRGRPMPEELKAIMERPLNDDELNDIAHFMREIVRPDYFYYKEAKREERRLDSHCCGPRPEMFRGLNGSRREGVIVRHNVKRRWEKLGVWNPEWGFAGRKMQPNDNFRKWTWWWQPEGAADNVAYAYHDARKLVRRALGLRQNLKRGEHVPVLPRSRLGQDTTPAEAEAFLISRPWLLFQIEVAEEKTRYWRLSVEDRNRYRYAAGNQVIKWWKERGDWRDEFNETTVVSSWKWKHESPSPEPEELAPVDNMKDSPLDAAAEMEFTLSEIDELETIDLPESEQPKGFWVIEEGDMPPSLPGQMIDNIARTRKREEERMKMLEKAKAEGYEPPLDPGVKYFLEKLLPGGAPLFAPPKHEVEGALQDVSEPQRDATSSPPQEQRCSRQPQPQDETDGAEDPGPHYPLPPRRSARIAGMKRPAEPLPSQTVPNKRPRGRAAPKATGPVARLVAPLPRRSARIALRRTPIVTNNTE